MTCSDRATRCRAQRHSSALELVLLIITAVLISAVLPVAAGAQKPDFGREVFAEGQARAGSRQMLERAGARAAVHVSTARELETAILQGKEHIAVTAHLDLTALPLRDTSICIDACGSPLPEIRHALSIRGNCSTAPTAFDLAVLATTPQAVALLPLQPGQCLVLANDDLLPIRSPRIWLDNLYLRAVAANPVTPVRDEHFIGLVGSTALQWPLRGEGRRFLTRVTLQGDGLGPTTGLWADEPSYAENCTFANLGGNAFGGYCKDCSSAVNAVNASVSLANCTLFEPAPFNGSAYLRAFNGGRVRAVGCTFAPTPDLRFSPFVALPNSSIFSDDASLVVRNDAGSASTAQPLAAVPALPKAPHLAFLARDDDWLVGIQQELLAALAPVPAYSAPAERLPRLAGPRLGPSPDPRAPPSAAGWPDPDAGQPAPPPDDGRTGAAPAVAALAAVIALLMLCTVILAACLLLRRRGLRLDHARQTAPSPALAHTSTSHSGKGATAATSAVGPLARSGSPLPPPRSAVTDCDTRGTAAGQICGGASEPARAVSSPGAAYAGARSAGHAMVCAPGATRRPASLARGTPPPGPAVQVHINLLQAQLAALPSGHALAGRFVLLGPREQRQGGHSVVAFARGAHDGLAYAAKFYVSKSAFDAQWALCQLPALEALTPVVHAALDAEQTARELRDADGRPLPPCIVMERGESLTEWSLRAKPDVFQAAAVLAHVAARLRDMHQAGYVHGDIKTSNIMLLPRENRWTLADLSTAASVGSKVPGAHGHECTAPEIAVAAAHGTLVVASPAQDAWALGLVAYELLTGEPPFCNTDHGLVKAQLQGQWPLPWEALGLPLDVRRGLGIFHDPVLKLLQRDPHQRGSMQGFCNACHDVVRNTTTLSDFAPAPA